MTPEQRIRMIMGLNGTPVPDTRPLGPNDYTMPNIKPSPEVPMVRMYETGMEYAGEGENPPGNTPMTNPDDWKMGYSFDPPKPPSNRDRIAAAHQKRLAQQRAMQGR
jgi:hypothetical protein